MTAPSYELWLIQDLFKVPIDRRKDCLRDVEYALALLEFAAGEGQEPKMYGSIRWTDDNSASVTLGLLDEHGQVEDELRLDLSQEDKP